MRATRRRWLAAALGLSIAASAAGAVLGCGGGKGPDAGPQAEGEGQMAEQVEALELRAERAADGTAAVRATNVGAAPVALLEAGTGRSGLVPRPLGQRLRGRRLEGGRFAYRATLLIDDPGPEARMPMPDIVRNEGTDEVRTCVVLAPGQSYALGQAAEDDRLAVVRYVRIPEGVTVLRLSDPGRGEAAAEGPVPRESGYVEAAWYTLEGVPAETVGDEPAPAWPRPTGLQLGPPPKLPVLRRYALWAEDLEALVVETLEAPLP